MMNGNGKPLRSELLMIAGALLGVPYCWAAKGDKLVSVLGHMEHTTQLCMDCSGFVSWCLYHAGGPDFRMDWSAEKYWQELPPTEMPEPADVAIYGTPEKITHMMMIVGDGRVIGATGGNSSMTSPQLSLLYGAGVKFKNNVAYRPDFRGYRSISPYVD